MAVLVMEDEKVRNMNDGEIEKSMIIMTNAKNPMETSQ